jgi:hypothetical protein
VKTLLLLLLITVGTVLVHAQIESIVNTTLDSTQRDPQLERDAAGNTVVVWNAEDYAYPGSHGDIVLQFFSATGNRTGGELLVNTTTAGDQEKPAAAMNDAGDLVVVWASMTDVDSAYEIMGRLFHNGVPAGPEFAVNTTWRLSQTEPDVAIDSAGGFVVVWDTWTDGNDRDVIARLFTRDGAPSGPEFTVNTTLAYSQARPAVKYFNNGSFVIVWESWRQDSNTPAGYGVYGRRFSAGGAPLTPEFAVNTTVENSQWFADVETFSDNSFIVVWCSWEQDGYDGSIVMQKFASDGNRVGEEVMVNSTTSYYQWLPRIRKFEDDGFAIVWSSWKQDGSREGVYCRLFDSNMHSMSFETRVNSTTTSFQWEPDIVTTGTREIRAVWSSWGQAAHDYEIVSASLVPVQPEGVVNPGSYAHPAGRTTTQLIVHVVDSLAVTGQTYEAVLDTAASGTQALLTIRKQATGDTVVSRYSIDRGEGTFYLTPTFDGVAVEIVPEFDLTIDFQSSYFINHSGTNIAWTVNYPTAGTTKIAPIDVALIWGPTDTLADGRYATPLDSATSASGGTKVKSPFRAWNLTDSARMDMVIVETRPDKKWNPGEKIIFVTPAAYRTQANNTHAEVRPVVPAGAVIMPAPGDTNLILTTRPIASGDLFTFTTSRSLILETRDHTGEPASFVLDQNYPNPFNAGTVIGYRVQGTGVGVVRLTVYDLLGREVAVLVDGIAKPGYHTASYDASKLASGVYFYRLMATGIVATKKMMVIK